MAIHQKDYDPALMYGATDDDIVASITLSDDSVATFGTTTTTPATDVELSFDKTVSGVGKFVMGTSAYPQVLNANPGALVKGREIAIKHSAGSGDCDDLLADYKKLYITGSGDSGLTPVTDRAILNVGVTGGANNSVISEGYVRQDTLTKGGTGATVRLGLYSGVMDLGSDNFTSSSSINAFTIRLQGTATVTTGKVAGLSLDFASNRTVNRGIVFADVSNTKECIKFGDSGPSISVGAAASDSDIKTAQGLTAPAGSIWISTAGTGTIWIMQTTTWTQLTIN